MDTELKNGRDIGSCVKELDLFLSLEINFENEVLRNFGRYFGDFDLGSAETSEFDLFFAASLKMSSTASSTEETFDKT